MTTPEYRILIGTAGHVDHGKTTLVEALTGIDCDRLEEEKARGITIDLGFAHVDREDVRLSFVDVPGHQRFLPNALAGLGGIRALLLVVAANEGIQLQTREHLAIAELLRIPEAIVALTKVDTASEDLVELARMEVEELLADGPFAGAPILAVSGRTGQGMEELFAELSAIAHRGTSQPTGSSAHPPAPTRLPVDRAFSLQGAGTIATGTLAAGSIRPGDTLQIAGSETLVRARDVQVHGHSRERAEQGERTSLQLAGAPLAELSRGVQLIEPGSLSPSRRLLARIRWLADAPIPLKGWLPVRVHHFSSELAGRARYLPTGNLPSGAPHDGLDTAEPTLEEGAEGWVEIRLGEPLYGIRGDALILRRPSPPATLGGGFIVDPWWRRRRGRNLRRSLDQLSADDGTLQTLNDTLRLWIQEANTAGVDGQDVARRIGQSAQEGARRLAQLAAQGRILALPAAGGGTDPESPRQRYIDPAVLRELRARADDALRTFLKEHRLALGMPKAQLIQALLPRRHRSFGPAYLAWLQQQGALELAADRVLVPGHETRLSQEETSLAGRVRQHYRVAGLKPPSPNEVRQELKAKGPILDGILDYLVARDQLLRLPSGLLIHPDPINEVARQLSTGEYPPFTVAQFRDRFNISRKWAIPILEHLDSMGVTLRDGDLRRVREPAANPVP